MQVLSPRQKEVLEFIEARLRQNGVTPSYREIGDALGIRSTNGVSDHVRALERKGYLTRVGGRGAARSIRLTQSVVAEPPSINEEQLVGVPLLGRIAAGQPITAEQDHENTFFLDRTLVPFEEVFALTVRGESMIEDGIFDGDYVFVRRTATCRDGEIAAVMVDGEATVKRVFFEGPRLRLVPSNPEMEDILVTRDSGEVRIVGVVVGVYRRVH